MDRAEIERKTEEVLKRDEAKLVRALELYYNHFRGDGTGMTLGSAARLAGANPAYIPNYMSRHEGLGMPSDREQAEQYLQKLRELKPDFLAKI